MGVCVFVCAARLLLLYSLFATQRSTLGHSLVHTLPSLVNMLPTTTTSTDSRSLSLLILTTPPSQSVSLSLTALTSAMLH